MVVRGAPAIAIAAALSLAVEVFKLDPYTGSAADAASFLSKKLEYLVSRYFMLKKKKMLSLLIFVISASGELSFYVLHEIEL